MYSKESQSDRQQGWRILSCDGPSSSFADQRQGSLPENISRRYVEKKVRNILEVTSDTFSQPHLLLMSLLLRRPSPAKLFCPSPRRQWISKDSRAYAAGDLVLLRQTKDRSAPPILSRPLKPGRRIESHKGVIQHDDLIGKRVRDIVQAKKTRSERAAVDFRIHDVTLEEYVRLSRRLVTPIYPADASLIVQLLDLHPDIRSTEESGEDVEPLEILEAGTGHGSLTLYLSRAIHAANVDRSQPSGRVEDDARRAIIHTIDVSGKFSAHAKEVVEGFKHGLYASNVDFHVGDVSDWLKEKQSTRGPDPFLSHAFLDLPSADTHLQTVARALKTDGTLIVFNPSITQINECAIKIKNEDIQLDLERIVELGVNGGSGGREWDVRFVRPRAVLKAEAEALATESTGEEITGEDEEVGDSTTPIPVAVDDKPWSMVCRPKVGEKITGGGFLGVFKRRREMKESGGRNVE